MPGPKSKVAIRKVELKAWPHNGEGRPDLQFKDPVSGEMIGGQVAAMRMAMRYPHCVFAWARRQGKTKTRQFLFPNEATITPGPYYAGMLLPDHTTAFKIFENFRDSWGGLVKDSKGDDKSQDRWVELHPLTPPDKVPPGWFTPRMGERWKRCYAGDRNTRCKIYFWGGAHPHYEKIQGFPHPFHRIDPDECQQLNRLALGVVRPMLRDVRGHEAFSGTPWALGIGNAWFSRFWDLAGDPASKGWFRLRIPDGTSPRNIVPATDLAEARLSMTESEIRQTLFAQFLTDEGAVFSNLERVFVLVAIPDKDPRLDWLRALRSQFVMPSMEWWISEDRPIPGHIYGLSIDWARSPKGDYSALTVFDFSTGRQVALLRWRGEDFPAQMEIVLAVQKHYGAAQLHSDANGMGEPMADFLRRRKALGFVGHKFGRNKGDYVRRLQILFREAGISLIDCVPQKREFRDFTAHESESLSSERTITYAAPAGEHDDLVACVLQLAPTLTIVGRQDPVQPEPEATPMFNEAGQTTLELFSEGAHPLPFRDAGGEMTWDSVVLPPKYR